MRFAEVAEAAFVAFRTQGCAGVSAVEDEPMMGVGNLFFREMTGKHLLDAEWCLTGIRHESQPMADAEDVGIDCHPCLAPDDTQHHIRGFASNTRKFGQLLHVLRHFCGSYTALGPAPTTSDLPVFAGVGLPGDTVHITLKSSVRWRYHI